MLLASDVIEWDLIFQVVWTSAAAGIAVTIAVSMAIFGATRAADARRGPGRGIDAVAYGLLLMFGVAICAAAVVLGIFVMTDKG